MEGDKGHEQRQGFYVDIWEKKISERTEKAIHSYRKQPGKISVQDFWGCLVTAKLKKNRPFGISL